MADSTSFPRQVVAVSGSLHAPSKSTTLLNAITSAIATRAEVEVEVRLIEVSELADGLGQALHPGALSEPAREAIERIESADLLVVASPVYRASYTGLFKHLFDLVGQAALAGTPVLVAASGGSERHALVIEHQLKPLFAFFEADVLPIGVYAKDADYAELPALAEGLQALVDRAADRAASVLARR